MSDSTVNTEMLPESLSMSPVDGESLREIDEVFAAWVSRNFNHHENEENRRLLMSTKTQSESYTKGLELAEYLSHRT